MTSLNVQEVAQFNQIAQEWWDEQGKFKLLHQMNPTRIEFITTALRATFPAIEGLKILDVGCGGGLVCEPLARLGAHVTGLDASENAIEVAKAHAKEMGLSIDYHCMTAEAYMKLKKRYDAILALEIVEHVDNLPAFLETCRNLLNKKGILILSTLNRTCRSYLTAIIGAEYVLSWVPRGTHDWNKFLTPGEMGDLLRPLGLSLKKLSGMSFSPFSQTWSLSQDLSVNYIAYAIQDLK